MRYQKAFIIYLISINLLSLIMFFLDKKKSIKNKYRIKEKTLLTLSLIGGCFGSLIGMYLFHHKTRKIKFKIIYIFCIIWIILINYIK